MKTRIAIALLAMVSIVMADPCTRIKVSDHDGEYWVEAYKNVRKMKDPTALAPSELDLGMDGINPKRKAIGWTPAYVSTNGNGAVYSKFVDRIETEMTQAEKDVIDQAIIDKKAAELEAKRQIEEQRDLFVIMFKMCNKHRPANIRITVPEAKVIVNSVIK